MNLPISSDNAYKGPAFIKEYEEIDAKYHKLSQTDEYPAEELDLKYLRGLFNDSFFREIIDWRTELYGLHRMTQNETRLFDYKFTIKRNSEELLKVNVRRSDNISSPEPLHIGISLPLCPYYLLSQLFHQMD